MDNITKKRKEGFIGQKMFFLPPEIRKEVEKNNLIKGLYLTAIGFYPRATHHLKERKEGFDQYILLYCIEGNGSINLLGESYILTPNHYFIIPKGVPHHYQSSDTDPWSIYWVHFEGENSEALYNRHISESPPRIHSIPYDEQRIELFNFIFNVLENDFDQRSLELINFNSAQFLSSFIYHKEMFPSYYAVDRVDMSIKFMKNHLGSNYTLQELADELSYSASHFSFLFKKKTGFAPIQYFNQLKIHKSCQYLYFTDMSIKQICLELGFHDTYYFSRLFKKLMGLSPNKYRNNYKK